ncbi:Papain-like cysteine peptidase [Gracilaria domingensis]|nr:Papain-like cysteine peptidase [Gracilaria domingensis]
MEKWICFLACKASRKIFILDAAIRADLKISKEINEGLVSLKTYLLYQSSVSWAGKYTFAGYDLTFPQQVFGKDSGVFVLMACRYALLGLEYSFTQADVDNYRCRFANELFVKRAT